MKALKLTPTSCLVLGLVAVAGRATPYDLKRRVADTIAHVWSFPHAQLYTEPARLAAAGLLAEEREKGGRHRRYFTCTPAGLASLHEWLCAPASESRELRDPGLLRLFFADLLSGAELLALAQAQESAHREDLARLETEASRLAPQLDRMASLGPLRMGLMYEQAAIAFWRDIAKRATKAGKAGLLRR